MTMKFETYMKDPKQLLVEHVKAFLAMIHDRKKLLGLIDDQQIFFTVRSLFDF